MYINQGGNNMATRFFKCEICGNVVQLVTVGGGPLACCGKPMTELQPNTTDAAVEKHVPAVTVDGNKIIVQVGDTPHPMEEKHFIQWIYVEGGGCGQIAYLQPGDEPKAEFTIPCGKPSAVYAYCNLHGLWKKEL
jgi:superoxide reductase